MRSGIRGIAARVRQISRRIDLVSRIPVRARSVATGQQATNIKAGPGTATTPARSDFKAILEAQRARGMIGSLTDSDPGGPNSDFLGSVLGGAFGSTGGALGSSLIDFLPRLDGGGSTAVLPFGANFKYNPFRDLEVTSPYGPREFGGVTEQHYGVDLAVPVGTPLPAIGAGRIVSVGEDGLFGRHVVYELDSGEVIRYAHMKANAPFLVTEGQRIASGTDGGHIRGYWSIHRPARACFSAGGWEVRRSRDVPVAAAVRAEEHFKTWPRRGYRLSRTPIVPNIGPYHRRSQPALLLRSASVR